MAEGDSSGRPAKKIRLDLKYDQTLYENFHKSKTEKEVIGDVYNQFFSQMATGLIPRQIIQCNADTNQPFSSAHCTLKKCYESMQKGFDEIYQFGSIFRRGVEILNNLLNKSEEYIPEDEETKVLLQPFLEFILDEDSHIALRKIDEAENATQLMMKLAVNFFCKLSVSRGCKMDKYAKGKEGTNFEKFEDVATFDDTSIGHKDVWHGNLDIILDSSQIGVHCTPLDDNEDSPGGRTAVQVKFKRLDSMSVMDQGLAQTITFSFLQHHLHPAMKHFLIPSILASSKEVQFLFYDSENDILLQSKPFPFFLGEKTLNYQTVIATWLVLNYKYLCTGPIPSMLGGPKADFPKFAGATLEIYKTKLRFTNVAVKSYVKDDVWDVIEAGYFSSCTFEWYEKDDNVKAGL